MFATSLGGATPLFDLNDAKASRLFHEHRKLGNNAKNYISAHPKLMGLGDDPVVQHLLASAGFSPVDAYVIRLAAEGRMITAICVPTRIWRHEDCRLELHEVKKEARALRTNCILVPQRWLRAETRSAVARVVAQARNTRFTRAQMDAVLEHLRKTRISTIAETAHALVDHSDPIGVVLAMAGQGMVDLDRSTPLHPGTWASTRL
ncbi:hypothetical protein [Devosia sediminis]|uniref:Uncharacterized protein n=1 Tax=Devosia sediminis TaxID=2798801 RepID=A0A934J204_9HYPH|nr:hypothetical protein [Devosia sediminis]MBJ3786402.1 hypothetical protein [Devosia sediminis]